MSPVVEEIHTPLEHIPEAVESARQAFQTGRTRSYDWRLSQLKGLQRFLDERQDDILRALALDLGKPHFDALMSEILSMEMDIAHAKSQLRKWMKPERVGTSFLHQPGRSVIYKEPLGTVLIIAPWNYPLQLTLGPLIGALAAGNTAILKPSEVSPNTSNLIACYLKDYLDPDCVKVIEGGVAETTELLKQKFDHIFYTGNGTVGRIVMRAAAENLTPVTLELGGKSPCIVDDDVDLKTTARRIVWGKFFNCGQTCVAPDHILVHQNLHDELVQAMVKAIQEFYGENPQQSKEYSRIVNERHFQRLMGLLDSGGYIVCGGSGDQADRYLAPTIVTHAPPDSALWKEEIFGPILPVLSVPDIDSALEHVGRGEKPLALYIFSKNEQTQKRVLEHSSSGGAMINHSLLHYISTDLPFGGVGESGMGSCHGKASFDTFTHRKSVMLKPFKLDLTLLYPNYSKHLAAPAKRLLKMWRKISR